MIETKELSKSYGGFAALDRVDLKIGRGEIVGLLGPNGAGKTTLLRMLTGYFEPSAGAITIDGIDVLQNPAAAQTRIGYLPESTPLYPEMLVQEYLTMVADLRALPAGDARRRLLSEAVWATGLEKHLTRPIGNLSRGFRQRVGLAQAILHRPQVLILDEPTSGLDPGQVQQVRALIRQLAQDSTVLFSTHILSEVEQVCERAVILLGGKVRRDARLEELRQSQAFRVAVVEETARDDQVTVQLGNLPGIEAVEPGGRQGDYLVFNLTGDGQSDVGREVFRLAKRQGWELGEMRPLTRTLEAVFREVVATGDEAEKASASAAPEKKPEPTSGGEVAP